ncbi:MAG: hypothetical protein A2V67_03910 [Deltaproteobacteria bacterium RBG_13_61_14]|nr:MAG: hypothetical protein A2V67_03910 [Deltaproteobacteria bacterium RBG_13_61_14]
MSRSAKLKKLPREEAGEGLPGYKPRTEFGRKLLQIRTRYITSGGKLLNWEEIDRELKDLRERNA